MRPSTRVVLLILALLFAATPMAHAAPATVEQAVQLLYGARAAEAEKRLQESLRADAENDALRFALGTTRFLRAVERLTQALYRHGLRSSVQTQFLPFVRLPVPVNPSPEPLTYELARGYLARFIADLRAAEETLRSIADPATALTLDLRRIHLDMNGDGTAQDGESLWAVFVAVSGPQLPRQQRQPDAADFTVDFDYSDAVWLQGYCNLLMALANINLAHDWRQSFDLTFHAFFPNAGLPYSRLNERSQEPGGFGTFGIFGDLIALIHTAHWRVVEPDRMAAALTHLEVMIALSRENWRRILAETDNAREWIPNPKQTGVIPRMTVGQPQVDAWRSFLDEADAILAGRKLVPHWRLRQGINLRRVFLEPSTFDPVLWLQGSAAVKYLEDGEKTSPRVWDQLGRVFRGDFFAYALWFN